MKRAQRQNGLERDQRLDERWMSVVIGLQNDAHDLFEDGAKTSVVSFFHERRLRLLGIRIELFV